MPRLGYPPQPPPRTITTASATSTVSASSTSPLSPPSYAGAPTSYFSPVSPASSISSTTSPVSPTERSFFGALAQSVRSRSRSRSRNRRSRSRSPLPPPHAASSSSALPSPPAKPAFSSRPSSSKTVPTAGEHSSGAQRKSHVRGSSYGAHGSPNGTLAVAQCGRHSNDWLFGGLSVRGTVRNLMGEKREGS